ncbi:MAG: hypothetical protein OXP09_14995 [Gammaproteobacteria bacterium]|nr:hypothetical protein [Gammaproteobacteria bacterium]MDE0366866.1 hypothetical protein [Gammaproteobacteria bacterium]
MAETVLASRKLQRGDAVALLEAATAAHVAKGRKLQQFTGADRLSDEAVTAMLGSTGNLRAPTLRVGGTLLVGFNESVYAEVFD